MFSGNSRYSSDFQTLIDRSVAIASLSLAQMKGVAAELEAESSALSSLDTKIDALIAARDTLESSLGGSSFSVSSSNSTVSPSAGTGAQEGTFVISVSKLGSFENAMTAAGVTAPASAGISSNSTFEFEANGKKYTLTGIGNLNQLAEAINKTAGADVQASVVNVGSGSGAADYRLSVLSRSMRDETLYLRDGGSGGANLLTSVVTDGAPAEYMVNKSGVTAKSESRTVTLAPGVSVELLKESTVTDPETTVTVKRNPSAISNALITFANGYNGLLDEIDKHRGQGTGALAGDSLLTSVSDTMRQIAGWAADGRTSAAAFGLELDRNGRMSVNGTVFSSATKDLTPLLSFLGSRTGGGFLKHASTLLEALGNDSTGLLKSSVDRAKASVERQNDRLEAEQVRIDALTSYLQEQFSAADAAIAALEQQAGYITRMFEAMRLSSEAMG